MLRPDVFNLDDDDEDALQLLKRLELALHVGKSTDSTPSPAPVSPSDSSSYTSHTPDKLRDFTQMATWTVSTAKPGNGIEQILDGRADTYWQSDGPQPHTISAHFSSKLKIAELQLYLDFAADESYTPASLSLYAGSNEHDLALVRRLRRLDSPQGWVRIPLGIAPSVMDAGSDDDSTADELAEDATAEEISAREIRRARRARRREQKRRERLKKLEHSIREREKGVNAELEAMRDLTVTKTHMVRIVIHHNHQNGRDSHVRMVRALGPREQVTRHTSRFTSKEFRMYETIR